jgi:hypothetical protein
MPQVASTGLEMLAKYLLYRKYIFDIKIVDEIT